MNTMLLQRALLVLIVVVHGASSVGARSAVDVIPREKRDRAPKFALRDLEDKKQQLSHLKGKIVVINFWATWCVPCRVEMPEFTNVHAAYRDRGVEFVGAANEARTAERQVREFVNRLEIHFPVWLEASIEHLEAFGVGPGLPATVIVDREGMVAARITGVTDAAQLRGLLDRILLESSPSATSASTR